MNILRWISRHYIFLGFVLLLVIAPIFFPNSWIEEMKTIIREVGYIPGLMILSFLLVLATVVAPINTLSLVPFASVTFGWPITTFVLIVSWTLGAVIAFLIARRFGKSALRNWRMFREAENYSSRVPHDLSFLSLIFLRMLIPVDLLSYAVGLFTNISLFRYTLATLIGVAPFSFVWSYGGEAVLSKEYLSLFAAGGVAALTILIARHFYKKGKN
jgi:uncharacterized membrane protein YdjX (TVP38/TMEM64 family)